MPRVLNKEKLASEVTRITVEAPQIARKAKAGQFVIVVADENGERVPLTLADWDSDKGSIILIFQEVGFTTKLLAKLKPGDSIAHILGPLGHPTEVTKAGTVICIGGGVGIAEVYPVSRAFKQAGNTVIGIIGSRTKGLIILEKEMAQVCDKLYITTDDGSYGQKGFVTDVLKDILGAQEHKRTRAKVELVYAIGPVPMMKAVSEVTRPQKIKTVVSLNPIMVDATGMCGACRCVAGGKTVFGCVEGPDFNGHEVDFDELQKRLNAFRQQERLKK